MLPVDNNLRRRHRTEKVYLFRHAAPRWVGWLLVVGVLVCVIASVWVWTQRDESDSEEYIGESESVLWQRKEELKQGKLCSYPGRNIHYSQKFNITNAKHLEAAQAVGIRPCATLEELNKQKARMRKIRTCHNYVVEELQHSEPYLTIGAANELNVIGQEFEDILERNGCPHYRFIITSVTRTDASIRKLQRSGNVNATNNSAHRYGTTFDITYRRFDKDDSSPDYMTEENLKLALAQVLLNEQRAGHIYVKYEYKQACFHITSRL